MTTELLRAGEPVWLKLYFPDRDCQMRVVLDCGWKSVVLCDEMAYRMAQADGRALVGKAYPRWDVRRRD